MTPDEIRAWGEAVFAAGLGLGFAAIFIAVGYRIIRADRQDADRTKRLGEPKDNVVKLRRE